MQKTAYFFLVVRQFPYFCFAANCELVKVLLIQSSLRKKEKTKRETNRGNERNELRRAKQPEGQGEHTPGHAWTRKHALLQKLIKVSFSLKQTLSSTIQIWVCFLLPDSHAWKRTGAYTPKQRYLHMCMHAPTDILCAFARAQTKTY